MIFQYQSPKRQVVFIAGSHRDQVDDDLEFISNTGGDFAPAPEDSPAEADEFEDRFGFWPQCTPAEVGA